MQVRKDTPAADLGPVGRATRAELVKLKLLTSVEGKIALRLAEQLDAPRNGMAVAPDARVLMETMHQLRTRRAEQKVDTVDDLRADVAETLRLVR